MNLINGLTFGVQKKKFTSDVLKVINNALTLIYLSTLEIRIVNNVIFVQLFKNQNKY